MTSTKTAASDPTATLVTRVRAVLRTHRRPAARRWRSLNRQLITPRLTVGMVVAASAALVVACGHSGLGLLVVLIGMCFVGIAGHTA